jgi:phosphopantetheinyl transferase (holo-ACP synthase)
MPEIQILIQSSVPETVIARVSATEEELMNWAKRQTRFPQRDIAVLSNHRKLEHHAVDAAIQAFPDQEPSASIVHDEHGKPTLVSSEKCISISHHTQNNSCWVMICLGDHPVGCDIERPRVQLTAIASRFLSTQEQNNFNTTPILCCAWGIKESMFKTIGHDVDFRKDLRIDAFQFPKEEIAATGNPLRMAMEVTGTVKGKKSRWQIWKVNPLDEGSDDAAVLYAVAGPLKELEPPAQ